MHGVGTDASASAFPTNAVAGDVHLDLGSEGAQASLGRGWSAPERIGGRSQQWMNALEADVTIEASSDSAADLWVRAHPLFLPYTQQRVALYVNGRFVSDWTCPHHIRFSVHRFEIPAGSLRPGPNVLTLRAAYRKSVGPDPRRLSLCVDQILLRPRG